MTRKVIVTAVCIIAAGAAVFSYCLRSALQAAGAGEEQKTVYAYVTAIEGNEITYFEVDEAMALSAGQEKEEDDPAGDTQEDMQKENQEEGAKDRNDNFADDRQQERQPPESGEPLGEGKKPAEGDMVTILIPVGVTVYTATDTKTTFSRLAQGDLLKLVFETGADGNEVIVEIYMMQ